ncbi:alpha/beta fold hydrolase [Pseudomonas monsensis]|uniref:alpha/beta fold hydrolase n=1 Tax=Pseudomonas monsensis TaxID=2745509 RepID=UPI0038FC3D50
MLICHALSGHHHAAGYHSLDDRKPGWWDSCIGPGQADRHQQVLRGQPEQSGWLQRLHRPEQHQPGHRQAVRRRLSRCSPWKTGCTARHVWLICLGIHQFAAVIGGSLGGMQALQWTITYPDRVRHCLAIASAPKLSAQNIAFNEVARQAILTDPEFHGGSFQEHGVIPKRGLMLARMVGHITYLSDDSMGEKFGRGLKSEKLNYDFHSVEFQVESYLRYQGEEFSGRFRCQHLSVDDQGAGLLRSGGELRR